MGVIKTSKSTSSENRAIVDALGSKMIHRGPDDYGVYADEYCCVGIRRLSILDLTIGLYPFSSSDKNIFLVLNGEIYNYLDLKKELEDSGILFNTTCDAEVILKGFELYGISYIQKLRGMFAIAIWVKNTNTLYLVRDRLGIKPLYYFKDNHDVFFASEFKAFLGLKSLGYTFDINDIFVKCLLGFMFFPDNDKTIIEGVSKVEAGTYLVIKDGVITSTKYWDITNIKISLESKSEETITKELEELLTESTKIHMLSDVPIGLFLSGGVDSSLLAGILVKKLGYEKLNTFTAHFDHTSDESSLAKSTAEFLGTNHHDVFIDTSEINKNIENYIGYFDSLDTLDGGLITTYILSKKIKEYGETVVILGEGADEIFGGYSWFGLSKIPFNLFPKYFRSMLYYYAVSRNVLKNFVFYVNLFNKKIRSFGDKFKEISFNELKNQLPNHFLMKVDKGSMAASIEARVPYLDHKLVEYVFNIPAALKYKGIFPNLNGTKEKYILRTIAGKYIPKDIAWRKKKGFFLPIGDILNQNIAKVKSYVLAEDALSKKFFSTPELEDLFKSSKFSILNMHKEYFLWRLFILEVWYKNFLHVK